MNKLQEYFNLAKDWILYLQEELKINKDICLAVNLIIDDEYCSVSLACKHLEEMNRDICILSSIVEKAENEFIQDNVVNILNRFFIQKNEYQQKWIPWCDERNNLISFLRQKQS